MAVCRRTRKYNDLDVTSLYVNETRKYVGSTNSEIGEPEPISSPDKTTHVFVSGVLALTLRISSFVGLAPLRFVPHSNGFTVSASKWMCVYSYILITLFTIIAIAGFVVESSVGFALSVRMTSSMTQIVSAGDILVVIFAASAGVYGAPNRMQKILGSMDSVYSVDSSIGGQYSNSTERKLCVAVVTILIFLIMQILNDMLFYVRLAGNVNRQWAMVTNYAGFYLLWIVLMVFEVQFAITVLSIRARFQAVNDALALTAKSLSIPPENSKYPKKLNHVAPVDTQRDDVNSPIKSKPENNVVVVQKSENGEPRLLVAPSDAIHHLASLYGSLCDVVDEIDDSYGVPLGAMLISLLLHLIITPYGFILKLTNNDSPERLHYLVMQFMWGLMHLLRLFLAVEPCHYTTSDGKKIETLVCQLTMRSPMSGPLPSRLDIFSRQLMLQTVSYTPVGMCTLDRPLVASILGAVTTYLVILIQFQSYGS